MRSILAFSLILLYSITGSSCNANSTAGTATDPGSAGSSEKAGSASAEGGGIDPSSPGDSGTPPDSSDAEEDGSADPDSDPGNGKVESVYTSLGEKECKLIEGSEDYVSAEVECPGIAGYKLIIGDYDSRQTIYVVFPDGSKSNLKFNSVVSIAFSEVGEKAEWRVVRKDGKLRPVALIVRYIYGLDPDKFSHLVVSKITNDSACVTGIVKEVKDQNVRARELADSSMNKPCLEAPKR